MVAPMSYWGVVPMVVGVCLVLWVNVKFRRAGTPIKPFEVSTALVVDGPFRVTRNPIYLGMVLFLFGVAMLLGSVTPILVVPLFALVIDRRFVRMEEAMLAKAFGPSYDAYKDRVRRWL